MATILLVEDNRVEQAIVVMLAAQAGVQVQTARTAFKALDLLKGEHRFSAVLMNYMLPAMNGLPGQTL